MSGYFDLALWNNLCFSSGLLPASASLLRIIKIPMAFPSLRLLVSGHLFPCASRRRARTGFPPVSPDTPVTIIIFYGWMVKPVFFKYALLWKKYTRNNPVCTNRIPLKAPLTACIRSFLMQGFRSPVNCPP